MFVYMYICNIYLCICLCVYIYKSSVYNPSIVYTDLPASGNSTERFAIPPWSLSMYRDEIYYVRVLHAGFSPRETGSPLGSWRGQGALHYIPR